VVIGAGAVVFLTASPIFYGFGTIFNEIVEEMAWSVGTVSLAFSLRTEVGGLASPLVGVLLDRQGPKQVVRFGVVITASGVLALSFISTLWHFYAAMLLIAVGNSALGGQPGNYAAATWFQQKRSKAMAVMTLGGGLGGVTVIGMAWLVETYGWRPTLQFIAAFIVVAGLPVGSVVRRRPVDHPQPMDGVAPSVADGQVRDTRPPEERGTPFRDAIRDPGLWRFFAAVVALDFGFVSVVVHQVPFLETTLGTSKAVAGASVTVFALASIVGRLGIGWIGDTYPKRVVLTAAMALMASGLPVLYLATETWHVFVAILLIAPGFGGSIPLRPAYMADVYGVKAFGKLIGIMRLTATTGGASGAWLVGALFDRTGEYKPGWLVVSIVTALAVPLMWGVRPRAADKTVVEAG